MDQVIEEEDQVGRLTVPMKRQDTLLKKRAQSVVLPGASDESE